PWMAAACGSTGPLCSGALAQKRPRRGRCMDAPPFASVHGCTVATCSTESACDTARTDGQEPGGAEAGSPSSCLLLLGESERSRSSRPKDGSKALDLDLDLACRPTR